MIVGDDELRVGESSHVQTMPEGPPMRFGFTRGDADAQHHDPGLGRTPGN